MESSPERRSWPAVVATRIADTCKRLQIHFLPTSGRKCAADKPVSAYRHGKLESHAADLQNSVELRRFGSSAPSPPLKQLSPVSWPPFDDDRSSTVSRRDFIHYLVTRIHPPRHTGGLASVCCHHHPRNASPIHPCFATLAIFHPISHPISNTEGRLLCFSSYHKDSMTCEEESRDTWILLLEFPNIIGGSVEKFNTLKHWWIGDCISVLDFLTWVYLCLWVSPTLNVEILSHMSWFTHELSFFLNWEKLDCIKEDFECILKSWGHNRGNF